MVSPGALRTGFLILPLQYTCKCVNILDTLQSGILILILVLDKMVS